MIELTHFKRFDNLSDYINYIADNPSLPNVSFVGDHRDVYCMNKKDPVPPGPIPVKNYFKFVVKNNGYIRWYNRRTSGKVIEYSKDKGINWTSITASTATTIPVVAGDVILFKGLNDTYSGSTFSGTTCQFDVEGNIMSLIYDNDFEDKTTLVNSYTFQQLFNGCTGLISAKNLELPATTLTDSCYREMFESCSSLVETPKLSAMTLTKSCYAYMFYDCTSLTTTPELPATTLSESCYVGMFRDCTSLTTALVLPATTLANDCYSAMFQGCTSLVNAPVLPATTLTNSCYNSMFSGCTSLTTAPELPATTLTNNCYEYMFQGCTSLNYIKCLATNISASYCTYVWTYGVSSTGTFVKNASMDSWTTTYNGIPEGWTVEDA